jgi:SIR2-like domain/Putative ATP-dependent DNA helicase recG C-terminal
METAQHRKTVNRLAALFRNNEARVTRPLWLLGAGCSVKSGVPLAATMVQFIARHAYAIQEIGDENAYVRVVPSDWRRFLEDQPWFIRDEQHLAENFPLAVEHLLRPPDFRQRFFQKHVQYQEISPGYRALGQIFLRRLCCCVLTPNFDSLVRDALMEHKTHLREIVEINRTHEEIRRFNSHHRCQIVYLHGAVDYYTDCNLIEETKTLNAELADCLWPMLAEAPIIVVGYRGAEPSVMEHLLGEGVKKSRGFKHGIYWCTRTEKLDPRVESLRSKLGSSFIPLQIDGFDELLCDLNDALRNERAFIEEHASASSCSWDSQAPHDGTFAEVDEAALQTTLVKYCERLSLGPLERHDRDALIVDLQLAVKKDGKLFPTNACLLLFGKNPQDRFEHARVSLLTERKSQIIFNGNLIKQWDDLMAALQDPAVNRTLRLKNVFGGEETLAYPPEAIRELVTNLLVHRDYGVGEFSSVDHEPGNLLTFSNPGGLPETVFKKVTLTQDGLFEPVPLQSECRNPVLADVFYGRFQMEKAGSGLPLVKKSMIEHGGKAEFRCRDNNQAMEVRLLQAEQPAASVLVATRRLETIAYTTNLLPFRSIPPCVYRIPMRDPNLRRLVFESDDEKDFLPICIIADGWLISFCDLTRTPKFAERHGVLRMLQAVNVTEILKDDVGRRHFVWLLGQHWSLFLKRFVPEGLFDEWKKKRAFFHLVEGQSNNVRYFSRMSRNVSRDVVKPRGEDKREHENEGFFYQVVQMSGDWAVMLKPTYVFTGADGKTPLPPRYQTSRATRRFRFDRKLSVENDLVFWSRFLGKYGNPVNLGRNLNDDLLLDLNFAFVELPATDRDNQQ